MTRRSSVTRAVGKALLALLLVLSSTVTGLFVAPASAAVNCDVAAGPLALNAEEGQFLRLLNAHRAANGKAALQQSETLRKAASWLAVDSAARKVSGHVDSLNRDIPKRFEDCGYGGFNVPFFGFWENVCCTNGSAVTADAAMGFWKNSPGHNENMLRDIVKFVGVARECASANQCYWVLTVGSEPSGATEAVPAAPAGGGGAPAGGGGAPAGGGGAPAPKPQSPGTLPTVYVETMGEVATTIQYLLRQHGADIVVDGHFGPITEQAVRDFQQQNGISPANGVVTARTWAALFVTVSQGSQGEAVYAVQSQLAARGYEIAVDGDFGPQTDEFVRQFQTERSLTVDGVVGPLTWTALVSGP